MERNNIVQELKEKRIKIANKNYIIESSPLCPPQADIFIKPIIAEETTFIAPGETCDFQLPKDFPPDLEYIVTPWLMTTIALPGILTQLRQWVIISDFRT